MRKITNVSGLKDTSYGWVKRFKFVLFQVENYHKAHIGRKIKILDVGCGTGQLITGPLAGFCEYAIITGIDPHKESIKTANDAFSDKKNVLFECKRLEDCDNGFYDVVICSEVLEHIAEYRDFLMELARKVRPGGIIIITVPNGVGAAEIQRFVWHHYFEPTKVYRFARRIWHKLRVKNKAAAFLDKDCGHVNWFRYRQLIDLFDENDLMIVKYDGRTFLTGPFVDLPMRLLHMCKLNSWLGSLLPYWAVSGWMFSLRRE